MRLLNPVGEPKWGQGTDPRGHGTLTASQGHIPGQPGTVLCPLKVPSPRRCGHSHFPALPGLHPTWIVPNTQSHPGKCPRGRDKVGDTPESGTTEPEPLQGGFFICQSMRKQPRWSCLHPQLLLILLLCPVLKSSLSAAGPRKVTGFRFLFFPRKNPQIEAGLIYGRFSGLLFFFSRANNEPFPPAAPRGTLRSAPAPPWRKIRPGEVRGRLLLLPDPAPLQGGGLGVGTVALNPPNMWGAPCSPLPLLCGGKSDPERSGGGYSSFHSRMGTLGWGQWL